MINHIIDKAFDLAYAVVFFGGAGVISTGILVAGLKCKATRPHIKKFFNLD